MTRGQLVTENEALHGLLAHACEALHKIANDEHAEDCDGMFEEPSGCWGALARDTLAQIKEGAVP